MKPKLRMASEAMVLSVLAAIANPVAADDDSGLYLGGNLGISVADIDDKRIRSGLLDLGFATTSLKDDNHELGYKFFAGYQFNRFIAFEGGYYDLGEFGYKAAVTPLGTLQGDLKVRGFNFDLIALLPITRGLSAFARGGANFAETKAHFEGTGAIDVADADERGRDTNYKFGMGLQYYFTHSFGMRLEAERYRTDDAIGNEGDVDLYSAGLLYRFGGETPPPPMAAVAPAPPPPVVQAPPPPPPPPTLPPPPMPTRVTFSADSLFDFDQALIKPAGRADLDKFGADLRGARYDIVTVTGHTDRIGSHAYNLDLSRRRAEAVRNYLVETGIPSGKISARGVADAQPVTTAGECTAREKPRASAELIACLQPDRRVEVEVTGTK